MDASERRREYLRQLRPWLGLAVAAAATVIGLRAIAAGVADAGRWGYLAGVLELGAGYVAGRRAWDQRFDRAFVGAVAVVVVLGVATLLVLELPPTVYERLAAR